MLEAIAAYPPPANKGKYVKIKYVTMLKRRADTHIYLLLQPTPRGQGTFPPLPENNISREQQSRDFSGTPINVYMREK